MTVKEGGSDSAPDTELAAILFPDAWAKIAAVPGEKARRARHNMRRRAKAVQATNALIAAGHSCGDCRYFGSYPGPGGNRGRICTAHSDFDGYEIRTADDICVDWSSKSGTSP